MRAGFHSLDLGRDSYRFPAPIDQVRRSGGSAEFFHLTGQVGAGSKGEASDRQNRADWKRIFAFEKK